MATDAAHKPLPGRVVPLRRRQTEATGDEIVLAVLSEHAQGLLALAGRHSLCPDDAHDAYQRALEIFLRKAESLERATIVSWLRTVVKHEAMALREVRQAGVSREVPELDSEPAGALPSAEERFAERQRLQGAAEALGRLKAQEVRALLLRADGHSYQEICAITGWTYTKVNRCLAEGRSAFRARLAGIESGEECERWAPLLSAVADGEASPAQLVAVRPHLRACPGCRATVREFHAAPPRVAALVPVAALGGGMPSVPSLLHRVHAALAGAAPGRVQAVADLTSGSKAAAIAASTVALAGGTLVVGRGVERTVGAPSAAHRVVAHRAPPVPVRRPEVLRPISVSAAAPVVRSVAAPSIAAVHAARLARARHAARVHAAEARTGEGEFGPAGGGIETSSPASATVARRTVPSAPSSTAAPAATRAAPVASASGGASEFGP